MKDDQTVPERSGPHPAPLRPNESRAALDQGAFVDALFEQSRAPLVLLDPEFNFLRVNQAYAKACAREVEDFAGRNHFEMYPSDTKSLFEAVIRTKKPMTVKARAFQFPDHPECGVTYWDWTVTPLLTNTGQVQALLFALEDVTNKKPTRPGRAAIAAWRLGRLLFERRFAIPSLLIGSVVEVALMYGIDRLGSPSHYLGLPGAAAALLGVIAGITGGPAIGTLVALFGGLSYFVFLTNLGSTVETPAIVLSVILWMAAAALAGLAADWVRKRAAERESILSQTLREREALLEVVRNSEEAARNRAEEIETLMDVVPAAISVSHDPQCRVIIGNKEASRIYEVQGGENPSAGTTEGELLNGERRWFHDGRELKPEDMPMQRAAATGKEVPNFEMDAVLPSGHRVTVFGTASPLFDERGNVRGSLAAYMDITERKQVEAEREQLLQQQRELNDRLSAANEELSAQGEELRESYRRQAQLALEQQLLFERLQRVFLDSVPEIPDVRFAYDHLSATLGTQIGGDFYDLFPVGDNCVALMVGDVSGQGIEASRIALMVKDSITCYAVEGQDPSEVLQRVNTLLVKKGTPGFVTAFLAYLDTTTGELSSSSAGHPAPLLWASGSARPLESIPAAPLGAFPDTHYSTNVVRLPRSGTLLLYTDGVTEARRDGSFYGEDRLAHALTQACRLPLGQLPGRLFEDVLEFANGAIKDDAAILAMQYGS